MLADLALAKRLERAEGLAGAAFVEARGGASHWKELGGACAMFDGPSSPLTQTFGLGLFEEASEKVLDEVESFFAEQGAAANHEICPLADIALMQKLVKRGYVPAEVSNVLYLDLIENPPSGKVSVDFSIRVARPEDADGYVKAAAEGWAESADVAEMISEMAGIMFAARGYTGFLVESGGIVAATAGLVIQQGVALFAGASTIPSQRGRGAQRAVLAARLKRAAATGCNLAMMVAAAGSASQRNAERAGFRIAYTRIKWSSGLAPIPGSSADKND